MRVVQNEPADWVDPDTVGLYAAIGIRKGQPFAPDARMKKILTDSVAVGNAIARANLFASRDPEPGYISDRQWFTPFVGGSYQFLNGAERLARRADDVLLLRDGNHARHERNRSRVPAPPTRSPCAIRPGTIWMAAGPTR